MTQQRRVVGLCCGLLTRCSLDGIKAPSHFDEIKSTKRIRPSSLLQCSPRIPKLRSNSGAELHSLIASQGLRHGVCLFNMNRQTKMNLILIQFRRG
jgi:hypothetical protein